MKELKCPKCGNVFTVDESDYADIVNQVKNAEFHAEVSRRLKEMEKRSKSRTSRKTRSRRKSRRLPSSKTS